MDNDNVHHILEGNVNEVTLTANCSDPIWKQIQIVDF